MSRVIGALCCAFALLCAPASAATDGQIAAIARTASGDRLVALNADGTGLRTLLTGQRLSSPGWSPDGNRIAVVDSHRVLILDVATGAVHTVIDEPGAAGPTWAPDGQRLALLRGPDVLLLGADGTGATLLPVPFFGQISWLSWSPDGARLAYGTSGMLRTISLDGRDDRGLVTATSLGDPAWSPDSTRIVYRDDGRLRVVPADGGDPVDLTHTGGVEPDWSPDGREIVYAYGADLRATTADGAATRTVSSQTMLAEPDWQPCVAGVTYNCASPTPAPPCCVAVTRPPVVTTPAPAPRAPYLSAVAPPKLDRNGRGWLRVRCDLSCAFSLRLVVRVPGHRIEGTVLERRLPAGEVLRLRLRGPARRRIRSAWVTGTVRDAAGLHRAVRIPVDLR